MSNKWVKSLVAVVIGVVAMVVLLYVGDLIAGEEAWGLADQAAFGLSGWATWLIIGAVITYIVYVVFADQPIWSVGTREVVFMAIGAVLYGVLSWVTNVTTIFVPSVSLVSLRPAIAIPPLFGYLFGPVVGFFTGAFGNILGDAITGWGVFPAWDVGNGLLGMVPGLVFAAKDREKALGTLMWVTAGLSALFGVLVLISPEKEFEGPITWEMGNYGQYWWVMLVGAALIVAAYYLLKDRGETASIAVWSSLGIIVGLGFASIADIWINGYTFWVAILGEFVPAAGPDILFAVILVPLLYAAYQAAVARGGR
jgi:hypothetical protein